MIDAWCVAAESTAREPVRLRVRWPVEDELVISEEAVTSHASSALVLFETSIPIGVETLAWAMPHLQEMFALATCPRLKDRQIEEAHTVKAPFGVRRSYRVCRYPRDAVVLGYDRVVRGEVDVAHRIELETKHLRWIMPHLRTVLRHGNRARVERGREPLWEESKDVTYARAAALLGRVDNR